MTDSRERYRQLQEAIHELEGILETDRVNSISVTRTDSPTPLFELYARSGNRTRGPYIVALSDVVRVLKRAELEITVSLESLEHGATVRFDRAR